MQNNLNKSSPTNFQLVFPKIPTGYGIEDTKSLTLNIYQTVVPSITLGSLDMYWQGGKDNHQSGDLTFEPWFIHFIVDSYFENWYQLYKWLIFIHNNKNKYGRDKNEFSVDATLLITDNFDTVIRKMNIIQMWPNMLGEIGLSYREGEIQLNANCNFIYTRFEM